MRVYMDLCSLKRPFDDAAQPRVRLEAEAVLSILEAPAERVTFLRSSALDLENAQNPVELRAARVSEWLNTLPMLAMDAATIESDVRKLVSVGFAGFDALHLASAEAVAADVFVTCDERLVTRAAQVTNVLRVRVVDPITLAKELNP